MIQIKEKEKCCGCGACVQICPKQCIKMVEDSEGFLYPEVDLVDCIGCSLCVKSCLVANQGSRRDPLFVYAAKNRDEEIRYRSSSGGVFSLFAEKIIGEGGIVFGARFDDSWKVVHDCTGSLEGLQAFRGSKYVQSEIGDSFKSAKQFLAGGRQVLFTGTSCQIAGLRRFLGKEYDNLLTIEVACHGVPSPKIWREYLGHKCAGGVSGIKEITLRDKITGWKNYSVRYTYGNGSELMPARKDIFMVGFLKDLYLRPSCYSCAAKEGKSGADIIIADYWGIEKTAPHLDDDKGVGLVMIYTDKGKRYYDEISGGAVCEESAYSDAVCENPCIVRSVAVPKQREEFWKGYYRDGIPFMFAFLKRRSGLHPKRFLSKIINRVKRIL